ncbi:hypothetical protein RZS28_04460 [Methylocapsa polymorpha]|uniref:Uncharacterized protein n=1 Tax=Methylocapsa polymorpha TaxID=3080828 RepID=A0ABZ0HTC6_9HYPH|nr:hypothetical protein RZS28_04460 [Methylocapsa sp. RX1]
MTRSLLMRAAVLIAVLIVSALQPADAFRGGGFGGAHFGGGGAWHAGGVGPAGGAWHAGGAHADWGGTWHADGWHAGGYYGGGFNGPGVVNHYYGGGCWNCGAAAAAVGLAAGAAATAYAIGALVSTVPAGCPYQTVAGANYYVCDGTWFQPYYGANGLYYRVVPPL